MLAPIPVWVVGAEKIVAGAIQAILAAIIVFPIVVRCTPPATRRTSTSTNWPLFLFVLVMSALAASLGLLLGTVVNPSKMHAPVRGRRPPGHVPRLRLLPVGAADAIRWLKILVLLNPLVYMSEGLRASLTPTLPHMPTWAFMLALVGGTIGLTIFSLQTFRRACRNLRA